MSNSERLRLEVKGAVQGVGFRPFIYRLATQLNLAGWVINDTTGVFIEVEGPRRVLEDFRERVSSEKPPRSVIQSLESTWLVPAGYERFEIRPSSGGGAKTAVVLPDIATCPDCLHEVLDAADRRHRYPFTNCTNCGPRFTIIEALPYDRPNTSMQRFTMCPACRREYEDPLDRRFHAQPNACPVCGPKLALHDFGLRIADCGLNSQSTISNQESAISSEDSALRGAASALEAGRIVAVKGLGGFHIMVDARNTEALLRLRDRKPRHAKPFAVMARDLRQARSLCEISASEEALLASPESPIVLLRRRRDAPISAQVAPGNPNLGIMLPYTPLHHLLLRELDFPIVATSGNLTDEPICTDEKEAAVRLGGIAEVFLVHDRPIVRHVDDSVAWVLEGQPRLMRRARGYAPLPVLLPDPAPTILAVGAHLKNTVALSIERQVFISQHIGDLETPEAMDAFERVIADFLRLYEAKPVAIAHDLHPDYLSTKWAMENCGLRIVEVQHHHAHLAACLADNSVTGPALGVTWDGTGYGTDGSIWGGEFLLGDAAQYTRVAHLRPFRLPGGDVAVHEPRRVALAVLWEVFGGERAFDLGDLAPVRALAPAERKLIGQMLGAGLNSPATTSAGRLFDAVAALLDLHQRVSFEGQAAVALEFAAEPTETGAYPFEIHEHEGLPSVLDWEPMLNALLADLRRGAGADIMAARFHNGLVELIVNVARRVGQRRVALTGGCFQNRLLTERAASRLRNAGFEVLLHRQVPPNDGGISLGQIAVAAARLKSLTESEG